MKGRENTELAQGHCSIQYCSIYQRRAQWYTVTNCNSHAVSVGQESGQGSAGPVAGASAGKVEKSAVNFWRHSLIHMSCR